MPLKCNFANKSALFLKQHRALFQSWAEHCSGKSTPLINGHMLTLSLSQTGYAITVTDEPEANNMTRK